MELSHLASFAAITLLGAAVNEQTALQENAEVLMDSTLRMLSFAGAIGGGFMALAFFPLTRETDSTVGANLRADAMRWLGCVFFGGCFGPFICEYWLPKYGYPLTTSTTLATSAFLGTFAWLLISVVHKFVKKRIL